MLSQQLTHRTIIRYDANIGHLFVPNILMRQPRSEKPYYVKTNAQGFRADCDFKNKNTTGEKRIAFIGDSFTAGEGVANEKRFSDLIAASFGAQSYNFALSASGVDQQYLIYKDIASTFDHDVLVLSPHIVDIYRNMQPARLSVEGQTGLKIMVPKPYFTLEKNELVRHHFPVPIERKVLDNYVSKTRLFAPGQYTRKLFHKYVPKRLKEELLKIQFKEHQGYEREDDPRWVLMRRLLQGIIETAGGKPVLLAPLPYHQVHKNPDYRERFIKLAAQYPNVFFVDILEAFKKVTNTDDLYFEIDEHYSEFGHKVIANEIIRILKEEKIFTACVQQQQPAPAKKSSYILGISAFYHDAAAALIKDGEIVAAVQEERFTRIKNDAAFPAAAINYCLEQACIDVDDLDTIVFYDHPFATLERIIASQVCVYPKGAGLWQDVFLKWVHTKMHITDIIRSQLHFKGNIQVALHHLSHAASVFYPSPFNKAAILTIDGVGEWATATIGLGTGNEIKLIKEMNYPHSVGLLYSAFTYYTGFKVNDGEYKLMGLAPYGEPTYVDLIKKEIVHINDDGSIRLNMDYFGFMENPGMITPKFESLFGGPARQSSENITRRIRDIAKSIQVVTEEIVIKMARHARQLTGADNLCMAGGVALNCVANGKILEEKIFDHIWIQPAAGDAGGALGAAMAFYYSKKDAVERKKGVCLQQGSLFGPAFSDDEVKAYLDSFGYKYMQLSSAERNKTVAAYLAEGKIVGHFNGRTEFGPRALGNRSILGDPRSETAQSSLNLKIKFRESFRPFAPSVLQEDVSSYFNLHHPSPYMLLVAPVKESRCIHHSSGYKNDLFEIVNEKRSDLPAITHVDFSARIQSVDKAYNPVYYDLINEFKKLTGYGVVINTSFNVNGEPIVCTPRDAVRCFMKTDMDVLMINNFILLKENQEPPGINLNATSERHHTANNKKDNAARMEAMRLFGKYFPKLSSFKQELTGDTTAVITTWTAYLNQPFFEPGISIIDTTATDITGQWSHIPDEYKRDFRELLTELIRLSKKYKLNPEKASHEVSDNMYVMF